MESQVTERISQCGYLRIALALSNLPEEKKEKITHLVVQNIAPTSSTNDWLETYHYQTFIRYLLFEVVPKFAKVLTELPNLSKLTLIFKSPLLEKYGFDKLAETINTTLKKLKRIEIWMFLANDDMKNEENCWTQKLREDIQIKII